MFVVYAFVVYACMSVIQYILIRNTPHLLGNAVQIHFSFRINVATLARRALVGSPRILRQVVGIFDMVACHLDGFDGEATCRDAATSSCTAHEANVYGVGISVNCPHLEQLIEFFFIISKSSLSFAPFANSVALRF